MDDGEGEFAFGEVFAEAFERGVARRGGEIEVIVEDLKEEADCGDEGCAVAVLVLMMDLQRERDMDVHLYCAFGLHELDR